MVRYAALAMEPLRVVAHMATPVIHAEGDATNLDGILSYAAIEAHPVESLIAPALAVSVPLPLALAWVSDGGQPLWTCTPLRGEDEAQTSPEYWHKRYPADRAEFSARAAVNTRAGRWKEYRVPVRPKMAERLIAHCIGNRDEIGRLLDRVSWVGKKPAMGYGRVARWEITTATITADEVLIARAVPVASGLRSGGPVDPCRGWTPPYWYAPWWSDCWMAQV